MILWPPSNLPLRSWNKSRPSKFHENFVVRINFNSERAKFQQSRQENDATVNIYYSAARTLRILRLWNSEGRDDQRPDCRENARPNVVGETSACPRIIFDKSDQSGATKRSCIETSSFEKRLQRSWRLKERRRRGRSKSKEHSKAQGWKRAKI